MATENVTSGFTTRHPPDCPACSAGRTTMRFLAATACWRYEQALEEPDQYPAGDAVTDDDDSGTAGQRLSAARSHRRSWWRWILVGLLLIFSLLITGLYVISLTTDLLQHRWGGALDASRDAVPAVVGWAALLIIFFGPGVTAADRLRSADQRSARERQARAERNEDSLRRAEQRVQDLTDSLAALFSCPGDAAGPQRGAAAGRPSSPQLARQLAETTARLDQARQWLASARAARAASEPDIANATEKLTTEKPISGFGDHIERQQSSEGRAGWPRRSRTKMSLAEVRTQSCPGLKRGPPAGSPRLHRWPLGP
jgi:hypothetical protein